MKSFEPFRAYGPKMLRIVSGLPDVERLTAPNPGPMTLQGTNTYVVGRDPVVVIDPGPDDVGHIEAIREVTSARGGIGTVLLTHGHSDHTGAVAARGRADESRRR
jgi:glyoxylase-like metal-dependent hydrolase (beta-lactamase superfamily II)